MSYIHGLGIICALGDHTDEVASNFYRHHAPGMHESDAFWLNQESGWFGHVDTELPALPAHLSQYDCRNARISVAAIEQLRPQIEQAISKFGQTRIGVVAGASTSGLDAFEQAMVHQETEGSFPDDYHYLQTSLGSPGEFIAKYLAVSGPAYTVLTACSAGGRAFASAKRLLDANLCDAVIVGGVDTLGRLPTNGFKSLEATSRGRCNPFSINRDGINIGEGAAFMLLSREPADIELAGVGDSSDAHHISAPHPDGLGAEAAMRSALRNANMTPDEIGYINMHGTSTRLNDAMESKAIYRVFGDTVPCTSTKWLTGHALGAAGAIEAGLCYIALKHNQRIPAQQWDGQRDPELAPIQIAETDTQFRQPACLSNSFAFGGNNVSVIFRKAK